MKNINAALCAIVFVIFGILLVNATPVSNNNNGKKLLGDSRCTWGPSYWCRNLTNAKNCHAVRHCIQTVWENKKVPEDNDSICQICKQMVQQARDQLRSNETMEEMKEVFEGSCKLILFKPVVKECCRLADDFIPELVEALSSQMNPDQVCSVAGLCNNAEIDKMFIEYYKSALDGTLGEEPIKKTTVATTTKSFTNKPRQLSCGNCYTVATFITEKFHSTNRDDILNNILHLCGEMSSFSDACSNIALAYFNDIYDHLNTFLDAPGLCHLSGVCAAKYHQHPEAIATTEVKEDAMVAAISNYDKDDIPCELCEQLVHHLRDLLVANTTEAEFKQVLEGLCNQTKGFKQECLSIVDQYYDVIYQSLVNNLDANGACFLIGICPKGNDTKFQQPIMPLLPYFPPAEIKVTIRKKLGENEPQYTKEQIQSMTLPIDHLMGAANPGLLLENGDYCTICEYVLHFIQETLATPKTEDDIKRSVENICQKLPTSVRGHCDDFIEAYGDALIALLIQDLNPREICPKLRMCPSKKFRNDMEVFAPDFSDKPTCPFCLFAVAQLQEKIKNDKSKQNIKNVLNHLCDHLPEKLKGECTDFIQTYSNELIDMLITDFPPQEICVSLKLCEENPNFWADYGVSIEDTDLNEIEDDFPVEVLFGEDKVGPNCWLCEKLIADIEKRTGKHTSKEEIEQVLKDSCDKMQKKVRGVCLKLVDEFGDKIADLILKEMEPKMICRELGLCIWTETEDLEIDEALKYDVIALPNADTETSLITHDRLTGLDDLTTVAEPPSCVLCEFIMAKLELELKTKTTQDEIKDAIETICKHMPKTISHSCSKFVEEYVNTILVLIGTVPPKEICLAMKLCLKNMDKVVNDEVIECGVCHGAAVVLLPYFKQHLDHSEISTQDMIGEACENVPPKYYQTCSEMISIYGKSILHLSEQDDVNEEHICSAIGKCFENEKSSLAFAKIAV